MKRQEFGIFQFVKPRGFKHFPTISCFMVRGRRPCASLATRFPSRLPRLSPLVSVIALSSMG